MVKMVKRFSVKSPVQSLCQEIGCPELKRQSSEEFSVDEKKKKRSIRNSAKERLGTVERRERDENKKRGRKSKVQKFGRELGIIFRKRLPKMTEKEVSSKIWL